ncbi:Ig domain-containing protein [Streptomyces albus]|uniref:Ig domain-containing protein n=1 Tax=Streptomyces albus TaxID=1888 RepID=UPI0036FA16BB
MAQVPMPVNIDYQVDVFTRKELHLIELTGALTGFHFLPDRFGYLPIGEDGTVRRLDLLGGPDYTEQLDEHGKRLFCATWALRVSSEIFLSEITSLAPAQRILVDFLDKTAWEQGHEHPLDSTEFTKSPLAITTSTLPSAVFSVPYRFELRTNGGHGEVAWFLPEGSRLPAGLFLTRSGVLFGTPTVVVEQPTEFSVSAQDSARPPQVATASLALTVSPVLPGS